MAEREPRPSLPPREPPETAAEFQRRMTVNLLGLIIVLLLLIAGFWLAHRLGEAKRAQDCMSAGHRNCLSLPKP